jgi:hypothetical protein
MGLRTISEKPIHTPMVQCLQQYTMLHQPNVHRQFMHARVLLHTRSVQAVYMQMDGNNKPELNRLTAIMPVSTPL